ncbi:hypothetical protein SLS62_001646 [Diatrype stigma]|uniref:Uncharacterized protein n=1 Tax=Diatrype stigma TaxID=117547 RepID=A0AAN9UVV3_9PEZI
MSPTDEELDRDWQPNGRRPQSTIARSFSQELMDIFKIEDSIADLDEKIDKRKQQVTTQTTELQSLEARIKEMEERLKRGAAAKGASTPAGEGSQRAQRAALNDAYKQQAAAVAADQEARSRPGTAKPTQQAPVRGGAMPPTPTASEGEYELVDDRHRSHHHHYLSHPPRDLPSTTSTTTTAPPAAGRSNPGTFADYVFVSKDGGDR